MLNLLYSLAPFIIIFTVIKVYGALTWVLDTYQERKAVKKHWRFCEWKSSEIQEGASKPHLSDLLADCALYLTHLAVYLSMTFMGFILLWLLASFILPC